MDQPRAHRVVVVGGGFGGLQATLALRRAPVEVTLVDRRNFHLFQPLTYQVATGALSPGEIAYPLRAILKRHRCARVLLAEVSDIDVDRRELQLRSVDGLPAPPSLGYDTLIVSGGSQYSYFGHDEWSEHAAEVKSLESALTVRGRILGAFAAAELERDRLEPRGEARFTHGSGVRPRRPGARGARPDPAGTPRRVRAGRHGPGPRQRRADGRASRHSAGRHSAGPLRGQGRARPAARPLDALVSLSRQGQPRHHRPRVRRC